MDCGREAFPSICRGREAEKETAGWGQLKENSGLAMRFPRFTDHWREDKSAEDTTTTRELAELYPHRTPGTH